MATTRQHIEMTHIDSSGNLYVLYPKNTLADVHTNSTSGVTIEGKVNFFGTCSTAAATAAKTATISGFSLVAGAHVTLVFTNGSSVADATLNINSTGAKAIYWQNAKVKANVIRAGARVTFVYDGSYYHIVAGANPAYVSNANTTKFYLTGTPTNESGIPTAEYFDTGVYVSATSGQLVASSFSGSGASLTGLNASNISSGTLAAARLATSGVTAGNYGPSANATASHGGTITVPYVTVDTYGRITACKNITYTLPNDNNSDEKVKNELKTTTKAYVTGTTSAKTSTGTQVFDTGVYLDTTAGRLTAGSLYAPTLYLGSTSAYVNSTNYTGKAASAGRVDSISGYIQDNVTGSGVTTKALSANQGYLLQNQINTLNSNKASIGGVVRFSGVSMGSTTDSLAYIYHEHNDGNIYIRYVDSAGETQYTNMRWIVDAIIANQKSYLPLSGGNMTGPLNFANNTWNSVGDDVKIGDRNAAGKLGILGTNGDTGIRFFLYSDSTVGRDFSLKENKLFFMEGGLLLQTDVNHTSLSDNILSSIGNTQLINADTAGRIFFGNPKASTMLEGNGLTIPINTLCRGSLSGTTLTINIG